MKEDYEWKGKSQQNRNEKTNIWLIVKQKYEWKETGNMIEMRWQMYESMIKEKCDWKGKGNVNILGRRAPSFPPGVPHAPKALLPPLLNITLARANYHHHHHHHHHNHHHHHHNHDHHGDHDHHHDYHHDHHHCHGHGGLCIGVLIKMSKMTSKLIK